VLWLCLTGDAEITLQLHAKSEAAFASNCILLRKDEKYNFQHSVDLHRV
jgi:hypothetical protein